MGNPTEKLGGPLKEKKYDYTEIENPLIEALIVRPPNWKTGLRLLLTRLYPIIDPPCLRNVMLTPSGLCPYGDTLSWYSWCSFVRWTEHYHFLDLYDQLCSDYRLSESEKIYRLPWYCEFFIGKYVRILIKGANWAAAQSILRREYKKNDLDQLMYSR